MECSTPNKAPEWNDLTKDQQELFLEYGDLDHKYIDQTSREIQEELNELYTSSQIHKYMDMASKRQSNYYGITDQYLYAALDHLDLGDKYCLLLGSANPWYEAIFLSRGMYVDVQEYSERPNDLHPHLFYQFPNDAIIRLHGYDLAVSISSFEHDGLGRYGDPLNPDGDFQAMKDVAKVLKPSGCLILSIPVGKDKLVWNAHRIYGEKRLPKLLEGWTVIASVGFNTDMLKVDTGIDATNQPIFILQRNKNA